MAHNPAGQKTTMIPRTAASIGREETQRVLASGKWVQSIVMLKPYAERISNVVASTLLPSVDVVVTKHWRPLPSSADVKTLARDREDVKRRFVFPTVLRDNGAVTTGAGPELEAFLTLGCVELPKPGCLGCSDIPWLL